jgi:hypothetical protein
MEKYIITLSVKTDTDPSDWYFGETLIIDEEYEVINIEKAK